ncbi:MAG: hypothetical protein GF383_14500 [Candidatus Lokiarchaeota archaeon]|nr:hypothetical protein [Candidatus Lokiarchaeota archaeon]MBD3342628.1 hypothetical protein [Candidatus Lokiarchaeota archaeon]
MNLVFVGFLFESFIIILATLVLILILKRYLIKKHRLTLYLFLIFLNLVLSVVFSWLSKILVLTTNIDYVYNEPNPAAQPNVPFPWLVTRIVDFRITVFFVAVAILISYILKVKVFGTDYVTSHKIIVYSFGAYTGIFCLFVYQRGNTLLDAINFLNVLVYMFMIYVPFMIRSIEAYKSVEEKTYRIAFFSLAIMSLSFILVFVFTLIDRITIIFGTEGFTPFYFAAWTFVIIGFLFAYLGYIRPKSA